MLASIMCWSLPSQAVVVHSVCASGCDYADPQSAENSLPASLSDNYVFEWQAGQTFTQTLTIRNLTMNGHWVIHRSSQSYAIPPGTRAGASTAANMAAIQNPAAGTAAIATEQSASYHRFEGLEIKANSALTNEPYFLVALFYQGPGSAGISDNMRSDLAHHIVFDRCYIHNFLDNNQSNVFSTAVFANTGYFEISNSTIMAFNATLESHAFGGVNGEGPFYVRNNEFRTSQIGTIFGGSQPTITGIHARSASFLGNYYYRPWLWRVTSGTANPSGACQYDSNGGESYNQLTSGHWWLCVNGFWADQGAGTTPIPYCQTAGCGGIGGASIDKNHFEIKNGWGFTADGNWIQNGWQPAMANQKGACVLLNQVDSSEPQSIIFGLRFANNVCDSAGHGIDAGVIGGPYNHVPDQIAFTNNLFTNIGMPEIVGTGNFDAVLVEIQNSLHYTYDHNTFLLNNPSAGALGFGQLVQTGAVAPFGPPGVLTWTNNIAVHGFWGLYDTYDSAASTNGAISLDYPNANIQSSIVITTQTASCSPGGSGNCGQTEWAGPSPACLTCYYPTSFSSVFQNYPSNLVVNSTYAGRGQYGTDPGVDLSVVSWSTQGAVTGLPNPYLDFRIRGLQVSGSTAAFTYTAPDVGACTLTVANNSSFSLPVYNSADNGANPDRYLIVTGLSPRTRYWWKMTCGSSSYRRSGTLLTR
ncbi:MAG TPA: hypothetical protein VKV74_14490 [Bryobacteraceae bacterium]|nr:hypothetical protein [Bryobacteraceae bacterium]